MTQRVITVCGRSLSDRTSGRVIKLSFGKPFFKI